MIDQENLKYEKPALQELVLPVALAMGQEMVGGSPIDSIETHEDKEEGDGD